MKNLHKRIGAIVLAGMMISGGFASGKLKIYAESNKKKYEENLYGKGFYFDGEYAKRSPLVALYGNDNDERAKEIMRRINEICEGKPLIPIKLSSKYGLDEHGKKLGISGFLDDEEIKKGMKKRLMKLIALSKRMIRQ